MFSESNTRVPRTRTAAARHPVAHSFRHLFPNTRKKLKSLLFWSLQPLLYFFTSDALSFPSLLACFPKSHGSAGILNQAPARLPMRFSVSEFPFSDSKFFRIRFYGFRVCRHFRIRSYKKLGSWGATWHQQCDLYRHGHLPILLALLLLLFSAVNQTCAQISKPADSPLSQARSLADRGMATEADGIVRQYLEKNPTSADGHFLRGYILFREIQEKEGSGAAKEQTTGETAPPATATYAEKLANTSNPSFRDAVARASLGEYTEGAKYRTPSPADLKIVALDYVLLGDYPNADKWLTKMLEWTPDDAQGWYYLGRTKYNENRFAEAISAFERCLKLDPKNVKAEDNLGLSYAGLGQNVEAATAYQTAIAWQSQLPVKNPGPYIDLGSLLLDNNKPDEAIANLLQAVEISPRDSKSHELLGKAYARLDQLPKAQTELEKALELSPQSSNLHCMLAPVYRKQGLAERAKLEVDRCAAMHGTHSSPETPRP